MNKKSVNQLVRKTSKAVSRRSPEILTGVGIAGLLTTTIMAVRATPKALTLINEAEEEKGEELTKTEVVKAAWKPYVPAAITAIASVTCLVGASSVNAKRTAALTAAYKISETALTEYRDKVVETIGEDQEQVIREKVVKQRVERNQPEEVDIINTGSGEELCLDMLSGRYFKSDVETLRQAQNNLNERMINSIGGSVSINDFYDELNLPHTDVGDILGWNTDGLIKLDIDGKVTVKGKPCITVGHYTPPKYDY